jgi:predicted DNA-binding transcriptional regulator YafY
MPLRTDRTSLTRDRLARLYRLVQFLGGGPKTRSFLVKKLRVDTRGFYRDFQLLRTFGVAIEMQAGRYALMETVAEALARLPFPDPCLSVQEVLQLARGRTAAHRKLRQRIDDLLGKTVNPTRKRGHVG